MKVLHTIRDTPPNQAGLCTLSMNSDNCYLAYPGSNTIGEVQIFDAINLVRKIFQFVMTLDKIATVMLSSFLPASENDDPCP